MKYIENVPCPKCDGRGCKACNDWGEYYSLGYWLALWSIYEEAENARLYDDTGIYDVGDLAKRIKKIILRSFPEVPDFIKETDDENKHWIKHRDGHNDGIVRLNCHHCTEEIGIRAQIHAERKGLA